MLLKTLDSLLRFETVHLPQFPPMSITSRNDQQDNPNQDNGHSHNKRSLPSPAKFGLYALAVVIGIYVLYVGLDWLVGQDAQRRNRIELVFTAMLALFTSIQAVFAIRQWQVMDAQNLIMVDQNRAIQSQLEQMRSERRPWLQMLHPELDKIIADKPIHLIVPFTNTGPTPATIVRDQVLPITVNRDIVPNDIEQQFDSLIAAQPEQQILCAPGFIVRLDRTMSKVVFSQSDLEKMSREEEFLFLLIGIHYVDDAGAKHDTCICFRYDRESEEISGYDKYNKMT
jgi:hypothetical protein